MPENEKLPPPVNIRHRLLGAVILVLIAVILLPLIFSQSQPPPEIAAIGDGARKADAPPVTGADSGEYVLPTPPPEAAKAPAAPAVPPPVATVSPAKPTPPPVKAAVSGWMVQVGIFANAANAAKLADKLKSQGHEVVTEQIVFNGEKRARLRVGPFTGKDEAQQAREKIQQAHGIAGAVLAVP